MNRNVIYAFTISALAVLPKMGFSQISMESVKANSSPYYWTVEANVIEKDSTLIRFYDSEDAVVHEEIIPGFLDITIPENVKLLDHKLDLFVREKRVEPWKD
ncbi:MAG: hypothetical protein RIA63_13825 [Cyclobacteriaceae bacterium]